MDRLARLAHTAPRATLAVSLPLVEVAVAVAVLSLLRQ